MMSKEYNFWERAYSLNWASEEDLSRAVVLGMITEQEKQKIME